MVRGTNNCQLSEAIQNLTPKLREKILKAYIATKLRRRADLGWEKVQEHISKLSFCHYMQQIVPTIICFEFPNCYFEDCCFPCFESQGTLHKVSLISPLIENSAEYKNFLKVCSCDGYDWHEWFLFGRER